MTRSIYYDEISYLITRIHECRERRMELMKAYALIQHTDSSGKNSLSSKMIQYNINLKRIDENIRKVERRHEVLKCQFEKIKQNAKEESMLGVNKMLNHSLNNQELQQVIKRTKQILDAQEITLKSISFNNNDDDEYDSVDNNIKHEELYKLSFINQTRIETPQKDGDYNKTENKEVNDKEPGEDEEEKELGQRRQIREITDGVESSNHVVHKIRSPAFSEDLNYSSDDFYKQSRLFDSNILLNNHSNDEKSNKNNNSQHMAIEEEEKEKENEEEEEDDDTQETEDEYKAELKCENVYPTDPNKKGIIQKGQTYEAFLAKATFSIEDSTYDPVNESNEHESEYDSKILKNNVNINEDMRASNKLFDSTNANLLSSWTTYKTEDLEDDSFYD
ncbi:hypothetical protein MS3_00010754 [Schistosoma haematobium]|uniref:Uncharacterized protein n=2 Tax=Schistosoma haematobium TaxID=6185 RepID=A0A922IRN0_SCHHA|nr:hypothetical protein MS3_00010754 [Schistosoma haematobium]KAH9584729.1 hypothetical protein MS3_00010754 [Schistosoma haematobium]CAH8505641.1 unnamed protein product [Schistosoma haematobium]